MLEDYFRMALSNLQKRRLRSWLTMLGIFIGIAMIVTLISLGQGLENAITSQFSFISPDILTVTSSAAGALTVATDPLTDKEMKAIESVPGVKMAATRTLATTQFSFDGVTSGTVVLGVLEDRIKEFEEIASVQIEEGHMLTPADKRGVVIGYEIAHADAFDKPIKVGDDIVIKDTKFKVVGIQKKSGSFIADMRMLMLSDTQAEFFNMNPDEYDTILVKVKEQYDILEVRDAIEKKLRKVRGVKDYDQNFGVEAAIDTIDNFKSTLFAVQLFIYIIAGVSILVGGIGIMNTMYTSVLERTKEIGIMKAIGARNETIFTLFFIESGLLGMVGGLIGITLGTIIGKTIEAAGKAAVGSGLIQAHITLALLFGALLGSFLLGSLSGILPAMQAAKLHPVYALSKAK